MQLLRRRPVVHPPEFDRAAPSALELDDHIQLLPVLRAEIVLRNLPATRDLALDHEIAALPVALDLDIPASIHYLSDLAAVVVEYQCRAAVRPERKARIGLDDHERGGSIEHQLHRLVHPLALLVAHPSPAPLTAAPPPADAPAPSSAKTATTSAHTRAPPAPAAARPAPDPRPPCPAKPATTSAHTGVPAAPAPTRLVAGRVSALEHVPRVVALRGIEGPVAGEIGLLSQQRDRGDHQGHGNRQFHRAGPPG